MICFVCGQEATEVRASGLGAMSFAYCNDCLRTKAEPYQILLTTIADIGLDTFKGYIQEVIDDTLKRVNRTYDEFLQDLANEKLRIAKIYEEVDKWVNMITF